MKINIHHQFQSNEPCCHSKYKPTTNKIINTIISKNIEKKGIIPKETGKGKSKTISISNKRKSTVIIKNRND